jgi:hypothetical protein
MLPEGCAHLSRMLICVAANVAVMLASEFSSPVEILAGGQLGTPVALGRPRGRGSRRVIESSRWRCLAGHAILHDFTSTWPFRTDFWGPMLGRSDNFLRPGGPSAAVNGDGPRRARSPRLQ